MLEPEIPKKFSGVIENVRLFIENESRIVSHLGEIELEYCRLLGANTNTPKILPMFLLVTAYRSFLAASTLMFSVQLPSTYSLQRATLESGAYALYIDTDQYRKDVYLRRDQNATTRRLARSEFTSAKIGRHMESLDKELYATYQRQYERTITFGGHPNPEVFRSYVDKVDGFTYTMGIFENNQELVNSVSDDLVRSNEIALEIFKRLLVQPDT